MIGAATFFMEGKNRPGAQDTAAYARGQDLSGTLGKGSIPNLDDFFEVSVCPELASALFPFTETASRRGRTRAAKRPDPF
jgi:hypothetical protein